jgi:hypothetical protein
LGKISFVLPHPIMLELNVIPFSLNPQAEDKVVWAFSSNGTFSFKDAYILAKD